MSDNEVPRQLELIHLLRENLEALASRPTSPTQGGGPLADHLECDLELLDEPTAGARDLIAATRWMMARLAPAERHMLVGLCERMGSFEAGIAKAEDLLAVAGTSEDAVWAMEHQGQLIFEERELEDLDGEVNIEAILFLFELEIKAGRRQDLAAFMTVCEQLVAIQEESADER